MSDEATTLCTQCGLCCNGALFGWVRLRPEEAGLPPPSHRRAAGEDTPPGMEQPCPMLAGTRCAIYAERPRACRGYRCTLLKKLEAGSVTLDAALRTVATARGLLAAAMAGDPAAGRKPDRDALLQRTRPGAGAGLDTARLHMDCVALEAFLDRHFGAGDALGAVLGGDDD